MNDIEFSRDIDETETDPKHLAGIYSDICERFGFEIAKKMHFHFGGQQVTFPIKFYDSAYLIEVIMQDYVNGMSIKELSEKYRYSERRIRQIVKGI